MSTTAGPIEISPAGFEPSSPAPPWNEQATIAVSAMAARQILQQVAGTIVGIILARRLETAEYGLYAIANFLFFLFLGLGDLGLGAAVLRQEREPETEELRLILATRQMIDTIVLVAVWLCAPMLAGLYGLPPEAAWLFRLIALGSFITAFQVVPTVLLERSLNFLPLAAVECTQITVQAGAVLLLVFNGFGINSFGWSLVAFAASGAILANLVRRWPIGWHFDRHQLAQRLPFSLPYQGAGLLTLAKDGVTPLLVGMLIGASGAGVLNLAQMLAAFPLLPLAVLQRVFFPHFSQIRGSSTALKTAVERAVLICNSVASLLAVLIYLFGTAVVLIVFGPKWLESAALLPPLLCASLFIPTSIPLISYCYASGNSQRAFRFTLYSTLATWCLGWLLLVHWGLAGVAVVPAAVAAGTVILAAKVQRELGNRYAGPVGLPWLAAAVTALAFQPAAPQTFTQLVFYSAAAAAIYGACYYGLCRRRLR